MKTTENPEVEGMLAVPDSASGAEVVPWVVRLEGPHPPQVLRVAGALATVTASRTRALMAGYTLLDAGLLASDRPVVELPDPTRWTAGYLPYGDAPVWDIPGGEVSAWSGEVSAWSGGIVDDNEDYTEDLDAAEQRALAILAAVAYARDLAGVPDQDLKMRLAELIAHREQCCAEEQDCDVCGDLADLQWMLGRRAEHAGAADEAP